MPHRMPFTQREAVEIIGFSPKEYERAVSKRHLKCSANHPERPSLQTSYHTILDIIEYEVMTVLRQVTPDHSIPTVAELVADTIDDLAQTLDSMEDTWAGLERRSEQTDLNAIQDFISNGFDGEDKLSEFVHLLAWFKLYEIRPRVLMQLSRTGELV